MEVLLDRMRREVERSRSGMGHTQLGTITSYDPGNHAVKVMLQPDGIESGWMPLGSPMVGNGWGVFLAPSIGDQVIVEYQEAGREAPFATLRLYDNNNRPLAVQSGEMWLVHKSGSYVKLTNDGKIALNAATEIDVGNLGNALHTLVTDAFESLFNNHVHTNGNGGANTGAPTMPMTSAHLTAFTKAN